MPRNHELPPTPSSLPHNTPLEAQNARVVDIGWHLTESARRLSNWQTTETQNNQQPNTSQQQPKEPSGKQRKS